jgi:hypothetical protein
MQTAKSLRRRTGRKLAWNFANNAGRLFEILPGRNYLDYLRAGFIKFP